MSKPSNIEGLQKGLQVAQLGLDLFDVDPLVEHGRTEAERTAHITAAVNAHEPYQAPDNASEAADDIGRGALRDVPMPPAFPSTGEEIPENPYKGDQGNFVGTHSRWNSRDHDLIRRARVGETPAQREQRLETYAARVALARIKPREQRDI